MKNSFWEQMEQGKYGIHDNYEIMRKQMRLYTPNVANYLMQVRITSYRNEQSHKVPEMEFNMGDYRQWSQVITMS